MSDPWEWTDEKQSKFQQYAEANLEISEMWTELRAALAEIDRLKQRCADSDAVNARYVRRVAELTDSAEDWHRVADARADELVKLKQLVGDLERDARYYALLRGMLIREGYLLMTTCNVADEGEAPDLRISIEFRDDKSTAVGHETFAEAIDAAKAGERGE